MQIILLVMIILFSSVLQAGPRESTAYVQATFTSCNGNNCNRIVCQGTGVGIYKDSQYTYLVTAKHVVFENGQFGDITITHLNGSVRGEVVGSKGDLAIIRTKDVDSVEINTDFRSGPVLNIAHEEASYHQLKRNGNLRNRTLSFPARQGASGSGVFSNDKLVGIITTTNNSNSFIIGSRDIESLAETCFRRRKGQGPKGQGPNQNQTVPDPADQVPGPANQEPDQQSPPPLPDKIDSVITGISDIQSHITGVEQLIVDLKNKDPSAVIKDLQTGISNLAGTVKSLPDHGSKIDALAQGVQAGNTGVLSKIGDLSNLAGWGLGLAALIGIPGLGAIPFLLKGVGGVTKAVSALHSVHTVVQVPGPVVQAPNNQGPMVQVPVVQGPGLQTQVPGTMRSVDSVVLQPGSIDTGLNAFQAAKTAFMTKYPSTDPSVIHQLDSLFNQFYSGLSPRKIN